MELFKMFLPGRIELLVKRKQKDLCQGDSYVRRKSEVRFYSRGFKWDGFDR